MNKVQMDFLKRFQNLGKFQEFVENIGDKEWAGKLAIAKWCGDLTEKRIDTIKMLTVDNMAEAGELKFTDLLLFIHFIVTLLFLDVVFSTAHKSKGLEWDTVALLDDFVPKLVSHVNIADDGHGEPNLLYVAVTRARRRLILNPACYYVLLFAGDRQEQIVPTDNQKLISSTCSSCRQEFPGRFGGRSASLATLSLQVMTDTGIARVFPPGVLCSTCAGLPWYNYQEFTSYVGRLQIERLKEDANHRALQFLAGPTEAEHQEANAFYAQRYEEMRINLLPAYAVRV